MRSTLSRRSIPSTARRICSGRLLTPPRWTPVSGSMSQPNLLAITTSPRKGASASPTTSSLVNGP